MAETIIGVGQDRNLSDIITLAEQELFRVQGPPRRIVMAGRGVEVEVEREAFEGFFGQVALHFSDDYFAAEDVSGIASMPMAQVQSSDREGYQTVSFSAGGNVDELQRVLSEQWTQTLPDVWKIVGDKYPNEPLSPAVVFQEMVDLQASDVHLFPGARPKYRIDGAVQTGGDLGVLSAQQILEMVREIAPQRSWDQFEAENQCSFRYHQVGLGYARVSAFIRSDVPHCTLRFLPESIPSFAELRIPADKMQAISALHHGLVLVTGMTGSGKSTTVASLIEALNQEKSIHILTVEDPVEYVHRNAQSVVSQREVGTDVDSFQHGVHGGLRHDPDVIYIGEMRDADTVRSAIRAAATGHLVISTMHASSAGDVVNQIISFFAPVERDLVRLQLRDSLRCVMCQRLIPKPSGGRIVVLEYMFNDTEHIGEAIYDGNADTLRVAMQQTLSKSTMFEEHLLQLVKLEIFELEEAVEFAPNPHILEQMHLGTYAIPRLDQGGNLTSSLPNRGLGLG